MDREKYCKECNNPRNKLIELGKCIADGSYQAFEDYIDSIKVMFVESGHVSKNAREYVNETGLCTECGQPSIYQPDEIEMRLTQIMLLDRFLKGKDSKKVEEFLRKAYPLIINQEMDHETSLHIAEELEKIFQDE
jgi:hypothetical protein